MSKPIIIPTKVQKMDMKIDLHHGVKIAKMGGQIIVTMKPATFCQVCHLYMLIQSIINKMMCMKVVDLSFVNAKRQIVYKLTTHIMSYTFYTKIVHKFN